MAFADNFEVVSRRVEESSLVISVAIEVARHKKTIQANLPPAQLLAALTPLLEFNSTHREPIEQWESMFNSASVGMPVCHVRGLENFWLPAATNEQLALMGGVSPLPAPNAHCAAVRLSRIFEAWICSKAQRSRYMDLLSSATVHLDLSSIYDNWPEARNAIAQFPDFDGQELRARINRERSFIIAKINHGDLSALGLDVTLKSPSSQKTMPDDPITLREMAMLGMIQESTVRNWGTSDRPSPSIDASGKRAAVFSYRKLREWCVAKRPDMAANWPEDFKKARATLAKMSKS